MKLTYYPIGQCWDKIQNMVYNIVINYGMSDQDVYMACLNKEAWVFMSDDGFLVLTEEFHNYPPSKDLFIWVAHSFDNTRSMLSEYTEEVKLIAKEIGASRIRCISKRRGLEKALPTGWEMDGITYSIGV